MQSHDQFEAIFKYASEAIIISNDKSEIININPSGLRIFGYDTAEELINKNIEILIPPRYVASHLNHRNQYIQHPKARAMGHNFDLFALKKDKSEFPVEISLSPFSNGVDNFIVCFVIDISSRKQSEKKYQQELKNEVEERTLILKEAIQKLETTKTELDASLKREQELNLIKTKFISIASHEFRTPLSTMLSSVSLVEKYIEIDDSDKRIKHIDRIKKSIRNLTEILNDILSVNRIEEGKVTVEPTEMNLKNFAEEMISELNGLLKLNQKIEFHFKTVDTDFVFQDPKLFRPILINLLSNAIKFSPENSKIQFRIILTENNISLKVKDEGIGIPKEERKKLFTRFFRAANVENIQGTGLGLSIVQQYLNYLKGNIKFTSKINNGTQFVVNLPRFFSENTQTL